MDQYFSKAANGKYDDFCERFARAFDCYIADKLKNAGIKNPYLSAHSEAFVFQDKQGETIHAVPMKDEREQINQKFDELIQKLKELALLHQRDIPEQASDKKIEKMSAYQTKTSITDIRNLVAEQRLDMGFTNTYKRDFHGR